MFVFVVVLELLIAYTFVLAVPFLLQSDEIAVLASASLKLLGLDRGQPPRQEEPNRADSNYDQADLGVGPRLLPDEAVDIHAGGDDDALTNLRNTEYARPCSFIGDVFVDCGRLQSRHHGVAGGEHQTKPNQWIE